MIRWRPDVPDGASAPPGFCVSRQSLKVAGGGVPNFKKLTTKAKPNPRFAAREGGFI
jgi:hypothetical protein